MVYNGGKLNKDAVYRAAKPKEKDYTINDGGGLALLVKTNGTKRWIFIYRIEGRQNRLGFGTYPDTSLENARRKSEEARQQIANRLNPAQVRNQAKQAKQSAKQSADRIKAGLPILDSFADVTGKWLDSIANQNSEGTLFKKRSRLTPAPIYPRYPVRAKLVEAPGGSPFD